MSQVGSWFDKRSTELTPKPEPVEGPAENCEKSPGGKCGVERIWRKNGILFHFFGNSGKVKLQKGNRILQLYILNFGAFLAFVWKKSHRAKTFSSREASIEKDDQTGFDYPCRH